VLPALVAGLWLVQRTAETERHAHEHTLRETARALALAVERELDQRATIAQVLAGADALQRLPLLDTADRLRFDQQARAVMEGRAGWIDVVAGGHIVYSTRNGRAGAITPVPHRADARTLLPLHRSTEGIWHAAAMQGVSHDAAGVARGQVVVTLVADELQALLDRQRLPVDWVGAVVDSEDRVVARHPGGLDHAGRVVTDDLRAAMSAGREGFFIADSLEGVRMAGYFSTSQQGWSYVAGMPKPHFDGFQRSAAQQVAFTGLALLGVAMLAALLVSRGIARSVHALRDAAARMRVGEAVVPPRTGIAECDAVGRAVAEASRSAIQARAELQHQVADAVERTRLAEQQASRGLRVEALGRLTGGVAHDFNNLLGVISNSAHLMQRQVVRLPELQAPLAATLRAVDVGSRLTQTLVRFAGQRTMQARTLYLQQWLPELEDLLRSVVGRRIAVAVTVASDLPPVSVDASELELALINLSLNARDAMPEGGSLTVRADRADADDRGDLPQAVYVRLRVEDDGSGVDAQVSDRLFEPFFTTKPVGKGTGLGLAQVHGFCRQAGGRVMLGPRPGGGTGVTLVLPAAIDAGPATAAPLSRLRPVPRLDEVEVLLVEDNEALGEATAALLQSQGARVRRAADPAHALAEVARRRPDVVLTDIVMPGPMDGVALASALRTRWGRLPVVLITGHSTRLPAEGELTVLRKPCEPVEMLEALRVAVAQDQPGT
jgi:signal transduction histidine kinase/CheY-like chemotaxis protein